MELPECGEVEVRLGHRALFEAALLHVGVSRETRGSVVQLLSTAAGASPLHATARSKRWPSIKAGLDGIGLSAEAIGRCRQLVLQVRQGVAPLGGCLACHSQGQAVQTVPSPACVLTCTMCAASSTGQAAGEAEAALFRLRTLLAHAATGRHARRAGVRPSSGAALACLDDLSQLLQYLQVCMLWEMRGGWLWAAPSHTRAGCTPAAS